MLVPLKLVLLLNSIRVGRPLSSIDQLLRQALRNALNVPEARLSGTNSEKGNRLIDSPQWGHINSLSPDGTSGTDTGGVFTGAAVDDGIDGDLDRVLVGHQVNDGESVVDDANSLELLAVVTPVHHERVGQALDDGALGLAEAFYGVAAGRVGEVDWITDVHVVAVGGRVVSLTP